MLLYGHLEYGVIVQFENKSTKYSVIYEVVFNKSSNCQLSLCNGLHIPGVADIRFEICQHQPKESMFCEDGVS